MEIFCIVRECSRFSELRHLFNTGWDFNCKIYFGKENSWFIKCFSKIYMTSMISWIRLFIFINLQKPLIWIKILFKTFCKARELYLAMNKRMVLLLIKFGIK